MAYSIVGILAIVIHIIVNFDIFKNIKGKSQFAGEKFYLIFLLSVIAYHITDGFWGLLYDAHLTTTVFVDTVFYFITMAASIMLWGIFVYHYLGTKNKLVVYAAIAVFAVQIAFIIANCFYPFLFEVTEDCVYSAKPGRYIMFVIQIFMFILLAANTFVISFKKKDSDKRHYLTIGFFSLFLTISIGLQVFFPLMPFYSLGYLLGICALHGLVVQDEKS